VGTWTNQFVYEQLPKEVLKTLKEKTPKNEAGQYTAKFHQSLTEDIGHPGLQSQISAIVALMQISDTMEGFKVQFEKLKQRRAGQLEFQMPDKPNAPKQPPKTRAPKPSLFDMELTGLLNVPPDKDKPAENKESNEKESKPKKPSPKK
jgi:hypothetical protein